MSSNEILKILSWILFSLTAVGIVVSIVIFVKYRILEVVQDLNGTLAQKQIQAMRERNLNENKAKFGQEILESGLTEANLRTGALNATGRMTGTGRIRKTGQIEGIEQSHMSSQIGNSNKTAENEYQISSIAPNGKTVKLQRNRVINSDFVIVKNIIYINTSEYI